MRKKHYVFLNYEIIMWDQFFPKFIENFPKKVD